MKEETIQWIEQATDDLKTAKYNFEGRKFKVSTFLCQQSVEKSLKAVMIEKKGELRKIHDLVLLAKEIGFPNHDILKELSVAYILTRYPDTVYTLNAKKVVTFIRFSEEALSWAKKNLSPK